MSRSEHENPYQCASCGAPIPSNTGRAHCPKCGAQLLQRALGSNTGFVQSQQSPTRRLGFAVLAVGLVVSGGAGLTYRKLDRATVQQNIAATLRLGSSGFERHSQSAKATGDKRDATVPWMIGGGAVCLLGLGMIAAGGGAVRKKKCPKCAELVMAEATICKHCRIDLS